MLCPDASDSFRGAGQPPRRRRPIELLNARWHDPTGAHRPAWCPACGTDIQSRDRTTQMNGALYHARCLPDDPRTRDQT